MWTVFGVEDVSHCWDTGGVDMAWPRGRRPSDEVRARIAESQRRRHASVDRELVRCAVCGREYKGQQGLMVHWTVQHKNEETVK